MTDTTMQVTIRDRSREMPWGSGPTNPQTRTVTISAYCPQCGGRRGEPRGLRQHEDGANYWVHVWDNPCRHIDHYTAVAREANARGNPEGR